MSEIHPLEKPMKFPMDVPEHFLIAPDGTRRFAVKNGLSIEEAYIHTMRVTLDIFKLLTSKYNVGDVTVHYTHPSTHLNRPSSQVAQLCVAIENLITDTLNYIQGKDIALNVYVQQEGLLPDHLQKTIDNLPSGENKKMNINVLLAYSSRDEVLNASKKMNGTGSFADFAKELIIQRPVHLILRTGGIPQLGDTLLIQSPEARLIMVDKVFPELTNNDIEVVLETFAKINSDGGKLLKERRSL